MESSMPSCTSGERLFMCLPSSQESGTRVQAPHKPVLAWDRESLGLIGVGNSSALIFTRKQQSGALCLQTQFLQFGSLGNEAESHSKVMDKSQVRS